MALRTDHSHLPIAITGMACRLPGAANLEEYWRLILEGRSAVGEVPAERLDQELYYDPRKGVRGKSYSKMAALLADRVFDHARCPLPEELRQSVDNTHLLMTGVAADALRHAGQDPFNLKTRNTAVFIGHAQGSSRLGELTYRAYLEDALALLNQTPGFADLPPAEQAAVQQEVAAAVLQKIPGGSHNLRYLNCNMVSGTIAKAFGLTGPWLALNSACASSLHAMLMGARALQRGRADMVIVGGASDCKSDSLVLFSNAQAMSSTNSRPFDADADGLIMSEGYVALVMKTLDRALADGDPIQAVVRGLGVATDGRGKSLWAPRKEGQIKAMRRAYRSGVDLARLQYLECHATATQLGDATEMSTLDEVLGPVFPAGKKIPITSVKANIGHALEAAGVAGVIKTVLCMQNRTFPRAINIRNLNPQIDWEKAPYFVPQATSVWEAPADGGPRRAAVNAFGIGGLNMHVALDEFTPESAAQLVQSAPRSAETADDRAVAVIGMSCILPGAAGLPKFWEALLSGHDPKVAPPENRWTPLARAKPPLNARPLAGGFITDYAYDWRKHKVPPKQVAEADPLQFMLLDASEQALADAGYDQKPFDHEQCGVVVGTEFGGDFGDQLEMGLRIPEMQQFLHRALERRAVAGEQIEKIKTGFADILLKKWPSLVDETGSFTSSTLASRISKTLDLAGGAVSIDSGVTSSMSSLALCIDSLLSGDNDMMICAAGQRRMGPSSYEALVTAGILAPDAAPKSVLDAGYQGIVPAEGTCAVVLKRLADARRDGDKIHAVIRGLGAAHHDSAAEAMRLAVERSCAMADVQPTEVGFAEIDTDEPAPVAQEQLAALAASHAAAPRELPLVVGSTTAQFGQLGGAGAMPALIKASLELENKQLAPTFGIAAPTPVLGRWASAVQPARAAAPLADRRYGAVANLSKGLAFHLILEDPTPAPPKPKPVAAAPVAKIAEPRIHRWGAASWEQLHALVQAAAQNPAAAWAAAENSRFAPADRVRLAIVADSIEALSKKLKLAGPQLQNAAARHVLEQQGLFAREVAAQPPRVAFVFPGQGSQYEGMLRQLVQESPAAAAMLKEIAATMKRLGYPTFAELAWLTPTQLGQDVWQTQVSMLLADALCLAALRERGVQPDLMLGHSYGEFVALYASGAWNLETAIQMTRARCEGIVAVASSGAGLLATNATPETIKQHISQLRCHAYLANFNAPDQTVVGAKKVHLEALAASLAGASYQAKLIPVPAAFHTPLMAGASRQLEQALQTAELRTPQTPVMSTVDNTQIRDVEQIRRNLGIQLTTPVRYAQLIAQLAAEAPTVFVEVGPNQTFTRLNQRIVDANTSNVACDNAKRPGLENVLYVQALLECLGAAGPKVVPPTSTSTQSAPTRPVASSVTANLKGGTQKTLMEDAIPHFDATERRRSKMRQASDGGPPTPVSTPPPRAALPPQPVAPVAQAPAPTRLPGMAPPLPNPPAPARNGHAAVAQPAAPPKPVAAAPVAPAPVAPPAPVAKQPAAAAPNGQELESFLINFVVEQTGYPPEVVELDADLEADLGIDSIKKAQLFGELQEYFDISTTATELSLDDFPTLRHVLNFLAQTGDAAPAAPAAPVAAAPGAAAPAPVAPAPVAQAAPAAPAPVASAPTTNVAELESFLVNFVVEQTGYPPEVVELDADLEADLGIDSIKKAQLFGELQEYFDIGTTATELSLDDFPTLRHVLNFLAANSSPAAAAPAASAPVAAAPVAPAPVAQAAPVAPAPTPVAPAPAAPTANVAELESFLVNFVVEQTGYPPEVVELDADLEADLGIDSIKKAQLFGELQEYFDIGTTATELSLDDFPTLRHVLNFLASSGGAAPAAASSFPSAAPAPARDTNNGESAPAVGSSAIASNATELESHGVTDDVVHVMGTPYEMGWRHGRRFQAEIRRILCRYAELADETLDELPRAARAAAVENILSADELDELQGMADAVEVPLGNLLAHHFAVAAELGGDAAQLAVTAAHNQAPLVHALRQSFPALAALREATAPEVFLRTPTHGLPHLAVAHVGSVNLLGGVNAAGIAITAYPLENAPGRAVSTLVRQVLESAHDLDAALAVVSAAENMAPWCACMSDSVADRLAWVEFDGEMLSIRSDEALVVAGEMAFAPEAEVTANVGGTLRVPSLQDRHTECADDTATLELPSRLAGGSLLKQLGGVVDFDHTASVPGFAYPAADALSFAFQPREGSLWLHGAGLDRTAAVRRIDYQNLLPAARRAQAAPPPAPQAATPPSPQDVTQRFILEMRDAPLPAGVATTPAWSGAAVILGDNRTAAALQQRLAQAGVAVHRLAPTLSTEAACQQLEAICAQGPAPHLFLTTGRDELPLNWQDEATWAAQRHAGMELPFFLCQRWVQLATAGKWLDRATLVATLAEEGDFGFSHGAAAAQGGAIAGLLKAIFIEYTVMQGLQNLRVKAVDAPLELAADALVDQIFIELASGNLDYEVAFTAQGRRVPFAVEQAAPVSQKSTIRRGATWVVTGGARGITAACALELGKRHGLKLHLLGSSPLPEIDPTWRNLSAEGLQQLKAATMIAARKAGQQAAQAWETLQKHLEIDRSLRAFETAGVKVTYHACDVADRAAVAKTLEAIRQIDGPIEGILHGAGIDRSCRFEKKLPEVVRQTIGAKVDGAAHLMALTERDPVRHFIGFGSISGRLGSFGQTDYCLSSDMLCKLLGAYRRRKPWVHAVGFHWHPWDEVGMAARPETKNVLQGKSDLVLMPLAEGIAHLLRELDAAAPTPEVLVTERRHWQRFAAGLGQLAESKQPTPASQPAAPPVQKQSEPVAEPVETVELRTERCELRLLAAPLPANSPAQPTFDAAVWILGENAAAHALRTRLEQAGAVVQSIAPQGDLDATLAQLDALWMEAPAKTLFLMTGRDEAGGDLLDEQGLQQRRETGMVTPFFVAQRWYKLLLGRPELCPGVLAAAVSLGGDFGFGGKAARPDGGAVDGLLKAIHIEDSRREPSSVRAKVIDCPADEPAANIADALLREIASREPEVEAAWSAGQRRVVRPIPAKLKPAARPQNLRGGVWVVTGGARGITAIAARELGRRYGWKLHLLGMSPPPQADAAWRNYSEAEMKSLKTQVAREAVAQGRSPSEAWDRVLKDVEIFNNLQQFADAGVAVTYHQCDIADRAAVARALDAARRQDGPIVGILHGAGLIDPGRFEAKRRPFVEKLLRTKFDGLLNLVALTQNDPLAYCVGFGSISGRFGGNGLTDYAAGNDAMSKVIDWVRSVRPNVAAGCIHWESWEGAGMATVPRFAFGPKAVMNMKYMMPEEGVRRLEQELEAGFPTSEVLYTFGDFYPMFYPAEQRPLGEFVPGAGVDAQSDRAPSGVGYWSLLSSVQKTAEGGAGEVPLDPTNDTFLVQHRLRDKPLLPVVVGLEALLESAAAASGKHVVGFRDVQMLDGLLFHTATPVVAKAEAKLQGDLAECRLVCDFRNRSGGLIQKDRPYLKATAELAEGPAALAAHVPALAGEWTDFSYPEGGMVYHGPTFRGVNAVCLAAEGGWGRILSLPLVDLVGAERANGWTVPSCVLDAALYTCGIHLWMFGNGAISLPRGIERLRFGRAPRSGETCVCYCVCREITSESAVYDFTVVGDDHAAILQATGYRKVILPQGGSA